MKCGVETSDLWKPRRRGLDLADRGERCRRAYVMDGNAFVNRPGPRLLDTAEIFASAIAAEQLPSDAIVAVT